MTQVDPDDFEDVLDRIVPELSVTLRGQNPPTTAAEFEICVRRKLAVEFPDAGLDLEPHPHAFPDIVIGGCGVEVKYTKGDTWRSVANSIFESTRADDVEDVYLVFGKAGGEAEVRWASYPDSIIHVRTSHVPRFEVEIDSHRSLFGEMGVTYREFRGMDAERRMAYVRSYAKGRLGPGERLWWIGEDPSDAHTIPFEAKLYTSLGTEQKRMLRAEAALLCPQVVKPSRSRGKYDDAALFLLTYRGVLCTQVRDLFSAGSVALRADANRGGLYIVRALRDIEVEMRRAAQDLDAGLFEEYWGENVPVEDRISSWLSRADCLSRDWLPSNELFLEG